MILAVPPEGKRRRRRQEEKERYERFAQGREMAGRTVLYLSNKFCISLASLYLHCNIYSEYDPCVGSGISKSSM
jgi:hypothetical protein